MSEGYVVASLVGFLLGILVVLIGAIYEWRYEVRWFSNNVLDN